MTFLLCNVNCRPVASLCVALHSLSPLCRSPTPTPPIMLISSDITAAMLSSGWLLGGGAAPRTPSLSLFVCLEVFSAFARPSLSLTLSLPLAVVHPAAPLLSRSLTRSRCVGGRMTERHME